MDALLLRLPAGFYNSTHILKFTSAFIHKHGLRMAEHDQQHETVADVDACLKCSRDQLHLEFESGTEAS